MLRLEASVARPTPMSALSLRAMLFRRSMWLAASSSLRASDLQCLDSASVSSCAEVTCWRSSVASPLAAVWRERMSRACRA